MREIVIGWLQKGCSLSTGEELYIPTDSANSQKDMYKDFRRELEVLKRIDPEESVKLRISTTYRDGGFWVVIKKIAITPLVAFIKSADGVRKVSIDYEKQKTRIAKLMEADRNANRLT